MSMSFHNFMLLSQANYSMKKWHKLLTLKVIKYIIEIYGNALLFLHCYAEYNQHNNE